MLGRSPLGRKGLEVEVTEAKLPQSTQPDAKEGPMSFLEKRAPQWSLKKNADFPEDLLKR